MSAYYRWAKSNVNYTEVNDHRYTESSNSSAGSNSDGKVYYGSPQFLNGKYVFQNYELLSSIGSSVRISSGDYFALSSPSETAFYVYSSTTSVERLNNTIDFGMNVRGSTYLRHLESSKGDNAGYVYDLSASAYPENGIADNYWYSEKTLIASPDAPGGLTYPEVITSNAVSIRWNAAVSHTNYPVNRYQLEYSKNGGSSWSVISSSLTKTSYAFSIPDGVTSIKFRVRARDSNNQWGGYATGTFSTVIFPTPLIVPEIAVEGQNIAVSWTLVTGASEYVLQRKGSTDQDWVQVYSGAGLDFSETAGAWATVQYRIRPMAGEITGTWTTSQNIPVANASSLLISGSDKDLGLLTDDILFTVTTGTENPITGFVVVNDYLVLFSGEIASGAQNRISILDLPSGSGTIYISAQVNTDAGLVNATRIFTYEKSQIVFSKSGQVAEFTPESKTTWLKTLAECVRTRGGKTLDEVIAYRAQSYVGSYVGTGTYGPDNPNSLVLPFLASAVFVFSETGSTVTLMRPNTVSVNGTSTLTVSWDDNGVSWYSSNAENQLNSKELVHHYLALS